MLRRALVVLTLLVPTLASAGAPLPAPSTSASPSPGDKAAARQAFLEGMQRYEAGDYAEARDRFSLAWSLVPLSTVRINVARCEEKLGRTATAYGLYVVTAVDAKAEGKSNVEALALEGVKALEPKVPRLTVVAIPSDAIVRIDGEGAASGVATLVDPGPRVVTVQKGSASKKMTVQLGDGAKKTITVTL